MKNDLLPQSIIDLKNDFEESAATVSSALDNLNKFSRQVRSLRRYIRRETLELAQENIHYIEKKFIKFSQNISTTKHYLEKQTPTLEFVEKMQEEKDRYFDLIRTQMNIVGSIVTSLDFQSPSFSHSVYTMAGKYTGKIIGTINDYKREGRLDNQLLEKWYLKNYVDAITKFNIHAYATNCGMAAFSTILNFIIMEKLMGEIVMMGNNVYHENKKLITRYFRDKVISVDELDTGRIIKLIQNKKPGVIFFDSLCNTKQINVPNLGAIINFLVNKYNHDLYLVIDNTCLSSTFQPFKMTQWRNKKLRLLLLESLLKYLQFGSDRVNAGMIIAYGKNTEKLMEYREHLGTNISDSSVYAIPFLGRNIFEKRLKRFNRNTHLLSSCLQSYVESKKTVIKKIIYPGLTNHPSYNWTREMPFQGSFFTLDFHKPSIGMYKKFIEMIVQKAAKKKVNISGGTSFGFNSCRVYLTALRIGNAEPFVRISVGTETRLQLTKLIEVFIETIDDLS